MKALLTVAVLAGVLAFAAPQRAQAGVHVSVGVGLPVFGTVVTTYPGYVHYPAYPAYHYGPPAVYVHAPVPYPRRWYGNGGYNRGYYRHGRHGRGHRHHRHCHH